MSVPLVSMVSNNREMREADNRLFNVIAILVHTTLAISPDSTWPQRIQDLIMNELEPCLWEYMGIPENWAGFNLTQ